MQIAGGPTVASSAANVTTSVSAPIAAPNSTTFPPQELDPASTYSSEASPPGTTRSPPNDFTDSEPGPTYDPIESLPGPNPSPEDADNNQLNAGTIIGIAIGAVVGAAIAVTLLLFATRRKIARADTVSVGGSRKVRTLAQPSMSMYALHDVF